MRSPRRRRRGAVGMLVGLSLAILSASAHALTPALAQSSADVRAAAADEAARLDELSARLATARADIDELDEQIEALAEESIALQGALVDDRERLAELVAQSYRAGGEPTLLDIALASTSLDGFLSRLYYTQKVVAWQTSCIEQVRDDHRELGARMESIERALEQRRGAVSELEAACDEASAAVAELSAQADALEAEERAAEEARLAELARQAEEERRRLEEERARQEAIEASRSLAEEAANASQGSSAQASEPLPAAETGEKGDSDAGSAAAPEPAPAPEPAVPEPAPAPEPSADDAGEWVTCVASAYTIADNTPPGSTATASGIPLDESVPTVAMPLAIGPERFFGQRIQIEYGGMTVVATVTDSGGMGGGSRGLDLTPAVFRAFGATSADDWGLRTVRYRFL